MAKKKYYVVWSGIKPGIYTTWDECKKQVIGVQGAKYKSFPTEKEAKEAYQAGKPTTKRHKSPTQNTSGRSKSSLTTTSKQATYKEDSICVDAACSGNPGDMEYQGVHTKTGEQLFHFGPMANGTNNIGEFLAIVHALAMLKSQQSNMTIYTDSRTAMSWVRKKKANTTIPRDSLTKPLWELIDRAEAWLKTNTYANEILKWETDLWGEVKADFGRK